MTGLGGRDVKDYEGEGQNQVKGRRAHALTMMPKKNRWDKEKERLIILHT